MNARGKLITIGAALAGLVLVGVGGSALPVAQGSGATQETDPVIGRTTSVCTTEKGDTATKTWASAVVMGEETDSGPGELIGRPISGGDAALTVREKGRGALLAQPDESLVLQAEGAMASLSGGAIFTNSTGGPDRGLSLAGCTAPATEHWFSGLGAADDHRSELVLTNPDQSQAEVDLRLYGVDGIEQAAGGLGIVVPGNSTRTVALESLVDSEDLLSARVRTTAGRIAVAARDRATGEDSTPAGSDWIGATRAPAHSVVVPGLPGRAGVRELVVANPSDRRTTVAIEALGADGTFAPADADEIEVGAESTAAIRLDEALAGEPVALRLTSEQPVTGVVRSTSERRGAAPDVAVSVAGPGLVSAGLAPVAVTSGTASSLLLSNPGAEPVDVPIELFSLDGNSLLAETLTVPAGGSVGKDLPGKNAAFLVAHTPAGSEVHGGVVITQRSGDVAGLTGLALASPDVAARAPDASRDPATTR